MSNKLNTIILAAGKGTRMKSKLPKVLHKIAGKALVERVIDSVAKLGNIDNVFVIVGHQSERVTEFLDNTYSKEKVTVKSVLQEPQLGTGDAVFKAYESLKGFVGTVLVLCGDTPLLTTETLEKFIQFHQSSGSAVTVLSSIIDNPTNYGRIVRDDEQFVKSIVEEKDATELQKQIQEVNAGVYCLEWDKVSPAFFDLKTDNSQGEYYLTDIVSWACGKNYKVNAFTLSDNNEILGINSKLDLANAACILNKRTLNTLMTSGVSIIDPSNTWISPETTIAQDTVIYPGCYIEGENEFGTDCELGPNLFIQGNVKAGNGVKLIQSKLSNAIIDDNSTVGPFAHLRDCVEVASHVRIGNFVEVKKSKIKESTNVSHLSYIGDSELGSHVNIGAGTITANYNPLTKVKSKTIIEDDVKIGSNSVLVAPVTIQKAANVAAGSVITKQVPAYSLAIERNSQRIIEKWVERKTK